MNDVCVFTQLRVSKPAKKSKACGLNSMNVSQASTCNFQLCTKLFSFFSLRNEWPDSCWRHGLSENHQNHDSSCFTSQTRYQFRFHHPKFPAIFVMLSGDNSGVVWIRWTIWLVVKSRDGQIGYGISKVILLRLTIASLLVEYLI